MSYTELYPRTEVTDYPIGQKGVSSSHAAIATPPGTPVVVVPSVNPIAVANPGEALNVPLPAGVVGISNPSQQLNVRLPAGLPVQSLPGDAITVSIPGPTPPLPTESINILDLVLDGSSDQVGLQSTSSMIRVDPSPTIVLAEVDRTSGHVIGVPQQIANGTPVVLTPEQFTQLTSASSQPGVVSTSTDNTSVSDLSAIVNAASSFDENSNSAPLKDDNGDNIEFEDSSDAGDNPLDEPNATDSSSAFIAPFKCSMCSEFFTLQSECDAHKEKVHSSSSSGTTDLNSSLKIDQKYKCSDCGRLYSSKPAIKKHYLLVHNKNIDAPMQKATSKCIHPGCEKTFYHRQKMIDHLRDVHGVKCVQEDLVFVSWDEFLKWKEKEEDANFVHFSKNSTHTNAKNYMLANFTCQREGKSGYKYKGSQQKKYKDLVIGEKICPARMRARLDKPTGRVTVQYCKSHNHKLSFQDFLYRRMPDWLRNEIREKLASGMTSEEIYKEFKNSDNVRENRGERFAPSKKQFVTLVNIRTLAKRMQIKETPTKSMVMEPEPVAIQIQKLLDETYNPVLLYKDIGSCIEVGPAEIDQINGSQDLMLIAIQTKEQKEMFIKHAANMTFVDVSDPFMSPPTYVVTVKVLDEYEKGYAVGYMITNSKDETVLYYFFMELWKRVCDSGVKVKAVMTENSCNEYYAFRSVFGEHVKHLLCKWNLHRAWCQKIHEECSGDEAIQQELYFIFVTMLEERNAVKFGSMATEFVNNYQTRCPNFMAFFVSNYLSQPEVWASCHRSVDFYDCDEVLFADRVHDRVKKETKGGSKLRCVDDLLDVLLRIEHDDYFNRGLNLMLNPVDVELTRSEHEHGMQILSSSVIENHTGENRWLVQTSRKDPADLQSLKEESFIVTWKADVCEKDFCRERCLKLACFGLCGHLYRCTCDTETVSPCRHIHKVHSLRIGVNQLQDDSVNQPNVTTDQTPVDQQNVLAAALDTSVDSPENIVSEVKAVEVPKLNLINQVHVKASRDPEAERKQKLVKVKSALLELYRFLDSDNVQRYSLDYIDTGLKTVLDELKVIDSIGQGSSEPAAKKQRFSCSDYDELEELARKRPRFMGITAPVCVDIEPDLSVYSTFRKRVTNETCETPEDRMLKLSKACTTSVNVANDPKYRATQSQRVTTTEDVISVKEKDYSCDEDDMDISFAYEDAIDDPEWTPTGARRSKNKSNVKIKLGAVSKRKIRKNEILKLPSLSAVSDIYEGILVNGEHILSLADIKSLQSKMSDDELLTIEQGMPSFFPGRLQESVINSFLHRLEVTGPNCLYLSTQQMKSLCSGEPHTETFWGADFFEEDRKRQYILIPWQFPEPSHWTLFVVDTKAAKIMYLDLTCAAPSEASEAVLSAYNTLVGLMTMELPPSSEPNTPRIWNLDIPKLDVVASIGESSVAILWYALLYRNGMSLDEPFVADNVRTLIFREVAGSCLQHFIDGELNVCFACKVEDEDLICCSRCKQAYHQNCLKKPISASDLFICPL